jgi:uncharacterized membrane protein YfcA
MLYIVGCVVIGMSAGFLSALLGVGGGVIMVPMLLLLAGVDMKVAIGTSLACIVPIALAGTFLKTGDQHVDWKLAALIVPFGVVGAYFGHRLAAASSDVFLKRIFGIIMILAALKMIFLPDGWESLLARRSAAAASADRTAASEPADAHNNPAERQ